MRSSAEIADSESQLETFQKLNYFSTTTTTTTTQFFNNKK